jgi:hypothetical protein
MKRLSKPVCVILGLGVLAGCASSGGEGGTARDAKMEGGAKMAAVNCMSRIDSERQACEQECPTPTGREHFSVQHKIARENAECKEQCAATRAQQASQCASAR